MQRHINSSVKLLLLSRIYTMPKSYSWLFLWEVLFMLFQELAMVSPILNFIQYWLPSVNSYCNFLDLKKESKRFAKFIARRLLWCETLLLFYKDSPGDVLKKVLPRFIIITSHGTIFIVDVLKLLSKSLQ